MVFAALAGSWTPASWITISFPPWMAMFGETRPIALMRWVMTCWAICICCGSMLWPF